MTYTVLGGTLNPSHLLTQRYVTTSEWIMKERKMGCF